jgi:hypothetical protein
MSQVVQTAEQLDRDLFATQVDYLPAAEPFRQKYRGTTALATVRSDAMAFFRVSNHKDRDVHEFFLTHDNKRITNLSQTLEQLLGEEMQEEKHDAEFDLVEQITPGQA